MKIGIIGLGKMGGNMARRLLRKGVEVAAYNTSPGKTQQLAAEGAQAAFSLEELVAGLGSPARVWLMLPSGQPTEDTVIKLAGLLKPGDMLIEGGNSNYKDSVRRAALLKEKGIRFVDAGVSGGIWGLEKGYCIMTGGEAEDFRTIEPLLKALCCEKGYMHCGASGSGHFTKMVHNGIEYGMMEAYGEGFELIKASPYGAMDLAAVSDLWNAGSVVRSWLLELAGNAFRKDPGLDKVAGWVEDSGEGRWTVQEAVERGVALPVITLSLFKRFSSKKPEEFSDKLIAALRNEFGGHGVKARG
ncbi:MAG: 6-phosphogluconate dehydrogenase (decarboxylating) [Elusimicrobia bacterium GWC2_64_44]|nr:MAG: 6-phosphogluconate dehydrogenase (decarboxylating) [Elusimicrobia bacterium GWC2_64_44]